MPPRAPYSLSLLRAGSRLQRSVSLPIRDFSDKKPSAQAGVDAAIKGVSQDETAGKGPNQDQLPHISEEAAAVSQIKGEQGPDVNQGTRIEDVLKRDKDEDLKGQLPKVMEDAIKSNAKGSGSNTGGKREFSTYAARQALNMELRSAQDISLDAMLASSSSQSPLGQDTSPGLLFEAPAVPDSKQANFKTRQEPLVDQVTKLLMRDGKLSVAQKNMATILNYLRTAPPPKPIAEPKGTLLPSSPLSELPLDPVQYLSVAIDSVAPLFRLRSQKGIAGGGVALQIPVPLWQRQRRRTAVMWILDAVNKKAGGATMSPFARRFAEEIVAIVEGKSAVWEKRRAVHGLGVRARANLRVARR